MSTIIRRKPKVVDPFSLHRIWVPAAMLAPVEKELVGSFEAAKEAKASKKAGKAGTKKARSATVASESASTAPKSRPKATKTRSAPAAFNGKSRVASSALAVSDEEAENFDLRAVSEASEDSDSGNPAGPSRATSKASTSKTTAKALPPARPKARSTLDDDEFNDLFAPTNRTTKPANAIQPPIVGLASAQSTSSKPSTQSSKQRKPSMVGAKARAAIDTSDWDDLFPSASTATSTKSSAPSKTYVSAVAKVQPQRSQILTDSEEDSEPIGWNSRPALKSPRKSREHSSPSKLNVKGQSVKPKPPVGTGGLLPPLSSSSDSDASTRKHSKMRRPRSASPTPRKSAPSAPKATLGQMKSTTIVAIDLSSSDDDEPVPPG